jgi:hypothetical protein
MHLSTGSAFAGGQRAKLLLKELRGRLNAVITFKDKGLLALLNSLTNALPQLTVPGAPQVWRNISHLDLLLGRLEERNVLFVR